MKVLISGSSGLVGTATVFQLIAEGHQVHRLVRSQNEDGIVWDPGKPFTDLKVLEGFDAVIHLAGESIAEGRWNEEKKKRIRDSRVQGTLHLSQALAALSSPPKVLVCASASGFYGNRGDEILTEQSPAGEGYLADVSREWEEATRSASDKGIRVVNLRFSIILSPRGGALKKMLPPFRMGVGGKIGSGHQYWSWVDLQDVVNIIIFCLSNDSIQGPANVCSPQPVRSEVFTDTLANVLKRPSLFPVPAFAARLALGQMADDLLLSSFRMEPAKLIAGGYNFAYPDLESSLRHLLT